jgi:UDP-N-acetylmuramate--alanine ligase
MRWRELLQQNESSPLEPNFFDTPKRAHFLGIGGIGMSALAFLLAERGHQVSGSDENDGAMPQKLRDAGIEVFIGHDAKNIEGADALFISSAISEENPELQAAKAAGIPCFHRSQLMAWFANKAKVSIAVSGTHGKSTTSAMIAHILERAGHNPTAILGAVYPPFGANFRVGDPDLVVVEADESDGSFTLLKSTVSVVLNLEPEHLENYDESEKELENAFKMFCGQSKFSVLNRNANIKRLDDGPFAFFYGFESGTLNSTKIEKSSGKIEFDLRFVSAPIGRYLLRVPGEHNVSNALGALSACVKALDISSPLHIGSLAKHLSTFAGTLRRFEYKGEAKGIVLYDDYGHHPTEVAATLKAAKEFLGRPICVIFQPHRYSRTQALWREFGEAFESADKIIITQLYSAHETPIEGVSGRLVFDAVHLNGVGKPVFYAENLEEAEKLALGILEGGDALLTMGAGDITKLGPKILEALKK